MHDLTAWVFGWRIKNVIVLRCYTTVGRSPGRNIVMLEANDEATCVEHDIAVHELMHTIGREPDAIF